MGGRRQQKELLIFAWEGWKLVHRYDCPPRGTPVVGSPGKSGQALPADWLLLFTAGPCLAPLGKVLQAARYSRWSISLQLQYNVHMLKQYPTVNELEFKLQESIDSTLLYKIDFFLFLLPSPSHQSSQQRQSPGDLLQAPEMSTAPLFTVTW